MEPTDLNHLENAIAAARSELESSQSELFEIEMFLSQARSGGHADWENVLVARRDEKKRTLERLRSTLLQDEESLRKASAN
jgi:hypothetical protein